MIKVTVQLVSAINPSRNKTWRADIWNDGTDSVQSQGSQGSYQYKLMDAGGRVFRVGRITKFPRKVRGVWDLLFRVLLNAVGSRNGDWTREEIA